MRGPQRDAGSALVGVRARDLLLPFRVPHTSFLRVGPAVGCHPQRSGRAPGANMQKHYDLEIPKDEMEKVERDLYPREPASPR
jgi:hypothetical protein